MHDDAPILVSSAQQTFRDTDPLRTPLDALETVARAALDAAAVSTSAIDAVATVRFIADAIPDTARMMPIDPGLTVARRLGVDDLASYQTADVGGNTPQLLVNEMAGRLARGEHRVVLLCGAELMATFFAALGEGRDLAPWAGDPGSRPRLIGNCKPGTTELENAHGLFEPVNTYPLFESAIRHRLGHDVATRRLALGALCSRLSAVAAENSHAWKRQAYSAEDISAVSERNRLVGFPYTRLMNALLAVDMAAAVLMTTPRAARELGIDESRWVYLRGCADLDDSWWVSTRPRLDASPALAEAGRSALQQAGLDIDELDCFDVYSCFPSALELACDALGIATDDRRGLTVTGGLPFFGGPGNNYSLHAIAELTERLRGAGGSGMVTAVGYYMTKHSVGVYAREPGAVPWQAQDLWHEQRRLDSEHAPRALAGQPAGRGRIEACTVCYDRNGPTRGIVLGSLEGGERFLANTALDDHTVARLQADDAVGQWGRVSADEPCNRFEF
jgi:acetyl-CoA C-acetyltransferase